MKMGKILVVDDEGVVIDSCRRVLEEEGFEVTAAASAAEAIRELGHGDFSLALIDVKIPGPDGIYLVGKVKEHWPGLPTITMTGYPTASTINTATQTGADAFLPKPFTPEELLNAVHNTLKNLNPQNK